MLRISLLFLTALAVHAQHNHPAASEKPVALLPGLGAYTHPIKTTSPEAQRYFDQGLALLYGFNHYESYRLFEKASQLDPQSVMPLWGMAMAVGPSINMDSDGDNDQKKSCAAVAKAQPLRERASKVEQLYIDAVVARCPEYKPDAYIAAAKTLYAAAPDDLDAATLYAESLMLPVRWKWFQEGKAAPGTNEAIAVLEEVMRRYPEHPGANHFYIHAVESSPTPERAIPSAQRLMGIVPNAGHLVHMPGHIWMQIGDYGTAAEVNERAAQVDREYMQRTGVTTSNYGGYYVHNLHFIAIARAMQGRRAQALKAAETLRDAALPMVPVMPAMIDAFVPALLFAQVRFGDWDGVLASAKPPDELKATLALWHWSRALAYDAKADDAKASEAKKAFLAARATVPADYPWLNNKATVIMNIAGEVLDARLAVNDEEAIPHWRKAVELQDGLVYDEPPPWFYPVRESLGGALLRVGQAADAETVFREGLRITPRNGRLLFGLREALKAQQKDADGVGREFERVWRAADVKLDVASL